MAPRPCLSCGTLIPSGSRCEECRLAKGRLREQHRPSKHERGYGNEWARMSKAVRAAQPWCARCGTTSDLTVDHVKPGSLERGVRVLCRRCHGSVGARRDRVGAF